MKKGSRDFCRTCKAPMRVKGERYCSVACRLEAHGVDLAVKADDSWAAVMKECRPVAREGAA